MKAITISVEYDDILNLTLPTWKKHFDDILVVTTPSDNRTQAVAAEHGARVFATDVFYNGGAEFNKGAAMEQGFDALGRDGWICVIDADIVLPPMLEHNALNEQCLYGTWRRVAANPNDWCGSDDCDWSRFPLHGDTELAGYFQLFNANAMVLHERPWYPTNLRSAASCDSAFAWKFRMRQHWLPFEVLHLGRTGDNWCGRETRRLDGTLPDHAARRSIARETLVANRLRGNTAYERLESIR